MQTPIGSLVGKEMNCQSEGLWFNSLWMQLHFIIFFFTFFHLFNFLMQN
jgi:hypothetical protein